MLHVVLQTLTREDCTGHLQPHASRRRETLKHDKVFGPFFNTLNEYDGLCTKPQLATDHGIAMNKLFFFLLLLAGAAQGSEIYKCVLENGTVTFSNNPYCEQAQAEPKIRNERASEVDLQQIAKAPPEKIIEIYKERVDLADLLEDIGRTAGLRIVPVGLEGNDVAISHVTHHWLALMEAQVNTFGLDYRFGYGKLYVYQTGSMAETIVNNPVLLRWYQSDDTWDVVRRNDGILLGMKAYENSTLDRRLHRLINMVRIELGESDAVNAAQAVELSVSNSNAGVSSAVAAKEDGTARRQAEKARRITARRQSAN